MDATKLFYSRPSYTSSFKVYYPNKKVQQIGGLRSMTPFERAMTKVMLFTALAGGKVTQAIMKASRK